MVLSNNVILKDGADGSGRASRRGSFVLYRILSGISRFVLPLVVVAGGALPARAQAPATAPAWAVPDMVAAAKAEGGSLVFYSAINEQEGLPVLKPFEDATGIKVHYVRGSDVQLNSRAAIEARANQQTWDVMSSTGVSRNPVELFAAFEVPEASQLQPEARDPGRRWYGVAANYNTPAYNTKLLKAEDLPNTYEALAARIDLAGRVAVDVADQQWMFGLFKLYGEPRARKLFGDLVTNLKPVIIDGHLALARQIGSGEYAIALNNYLPMTLNVKLGGGATDFWVPGPVVLFFHQIGISARAPHPNSAALLANYLLSRDAQQLSTRWGRLPTRPDVAPNPPDLRKRLEGHKIVPVVLTAEDDRKWLKTYQDIVRAR